MSDTPVLPEVGQIGDRRRNRRVRPGFHLSARLGLREGELVDLSTAGARVRHAGPLKLGSAVPLSVLIGTQRFVTTARVLTCSVVALGTGDDGATVFESRLEFEDHSPSTAAIVNRLLDEAV